MKKLGRKALITLSIFTLVGFPSLGYIIHFYTSGSTFTSIFITKHNLLIELISGSLFGLIAGVIGWKIICLEFMKPVLNKYKNLISSAELDVSLIVFISFCAGVGEETLFRGVLQPLFGIWITSLFFVAIHGYLHPTNWRISIYGIYLTLVIGVIGYLTELLGLCTAIIAHMVIDIILFYKLKKPTVT